MCGRDVLADGVTLVAIDASLTLLEVDGVAREVPVDDGVAPPVEVDPLLTDRRRRQHKRPERRVEGRPDFGEAGFVLLVSGAAKPQRVPAREGDPLALEVVDVGGAVDRLPEGDGSPRGRGQRDQPFVGRGVDARLSGEVVDVLVENGLEPSVDAVAGDPAPIRAVVLARAT